ncbi:MAG: DUF3418 domain-containing protein, partial [Candidatus Omnitrophica bacterium]|nr:DUF3418 domain-containing protein [Candidatus Omnitrophota bacterium]
PTIGRMILQAQHEGALREVLIIAAGLSIQDPRERPADRAEAAAAAHRRFQHPKSDFLTLLNIWEAYHDSLESLRTQSQMRKFCKTHFLSYPRVREWRDIHAQLVLALEEMGGFTENDSPAEYAAIHRAILTGLWSNVAVSKERNMFQLGGNRQAMVFPGSILFTRSAENQARQDRGDADQKAARKPARLKWIVAGERVETSRLFLRTAAEIEPRWIPELAPHLCRSEYLEPHWDARSGRVLARERMTLNGLVVTDHLVPLAKVNPAQATEIFIRSALVGEELTDPCPFLEHNRQLRQKIEIWQTRLRQRVVPDLDEAMFQFYAKRLEKVSSSAELGRVLHERQSSEPAFLRLAPSDLLGPHAIEFDAQAFPDTLPVGGQDVSVDYAYAPGEDRDGVTMRLPFTLAQVIEPGVLDWAVPGLREPQILHLLQALPKALRRGLMPLAPKAKEMADMVPAKGQGFLAALIEFVRRQYGVAIPASAWKIDMLPAHLRPRLEVLGPDLKPLAEGRDLPALREQLARHIEADQARAWQQAAQGWERYGLEAWSFGDLPESLVIAEKSDFPLTAFPGLQIEAGEINLRLFRRREEAESAHPLGVQGLLGKVLKKELAWMQKDLRALAKYRDLYLTIGPPEELEETAFENLKQYLFDTPKPWPRTQAGFAVLVEETRARLPGLARQLIEWTSQILKFRHETLLCPRPYPRMKSDLDQLLPRPFLRHIPFLRLRFIPRYLKALIVRAERAAVSPAKDQDKYRRVQPYLVVWARLSSAKASNSLFREKMNSCRWLLEEFKVSLFAQELGTAEPVSPQKLERVLAEAQNLMEA